MGVRRNIGRLLTFRDFEARFKVRFGKGDRAAWVFRVQPGGGSGYLFELKRIKNDLFLQGTVWQRKGRSQPLTSDPGYAIRLGPCCEPDEAFEIISWVRGPEFVFDVRRYPKDIPKDDRIKWVSPFRVKFWDSTHSHGNVGLMQTHREDEMLVESWCVSPNPGGCVPSVSP